MRAWYKIAAVAGLLVGLADTALASITVDCRLSGPGDACVVPVETGGSGSLAVCTTAAEPGQRWRATLIRQGGNANGAAASSVGNGSTAACTGWASLPSDPGQRFLALVSDERPEVGAYPKAVRLGLHGPVAAVDRRRDATPTDPLLAAARACVKKPKTAGCTIVDTARDYVVLKDKSPHKPFGYLTVPTFPVTGIEDPQVVAKAFPNFFAYAWTDARLHVAALKKPPENTGLAINSVAGRTLNQFHIHMACVHKSVRDALAKARAAGTITTAWQAKPYLALGSRGHLYNVIYASSLTVSPFQQLLRIAGAKAHMKDQTLAVIGHAGGGYFILNDFTAGTDQAQAEELLDQRCAS